MAAQAALKAGVGLLTVGIPESLHAAFAARRPEAMWVPLPETPEGGGSRRFGQSSAIPFQSDGLGHRTGFGYGRRNPFPGERNPFLFRGPGRFGCRCPASGNPKRCSKPRTACLDPACRGIRPSLRGPIPEECDVSGRKRSRAQGGYYANCFSVSSSFFFRRQFLACPWWKRRSAYRDFGRPACQKNIRHPDLRFPGRSLAWPGPPSARPSKRAGSGLLDRPARFPILCHSK